MNDWIKLTIRGGRLVYLRRSTIESIIPQPDDGGTFVTTMSGAEYVVVERLDDIVASVAETPAGAEA